MSRCRPSTPRFSAADGFSSIETLVALVVTTIAMALGMSLLLAGTSQVREQGKELEASQGARAVLDMLLRELRLGGACLPVTGTFVTMNGVNAGTSDELTVRSGTTNADLSCVRAAVTTMASASSTTLNIDDISGFLAGMHAYLRHPDGSGQYVSIGSVDIPNGQLTLASGVGKDFPPTTGVYAIEERRFFLGTRVIAGYSTPELLVAVDGGTPYSFAVGVESFDIQYRLGDGTLVALPADDGQWASVNQLEVSITVRSLLANRQGDYYRRTLSGTIKPRNLIES